ncbi:MAG: class I SAM-dependent methyltransferase [Dehalococcoidia bacterium]|jgi:SAM-dependent methyltransferase
MKDGDKIRAYGKNYSPTKEILTPKGMKPTSNINQQTVTNLDVMKILRRGMNLSQVRTVLDLGCGSFLDSKFDYKVQDILLNIFGDKEIKGLDIFKPNIDWRNEFGPKGVYEQVDITKYDFNEKYDVVICHHVLEHLTQEEHDKVLENIEKTFTKYAVLGGPVGYHDNTFHVRKSGNSNEEHKIGLNPEVYKKLGYEIFLIGKVFVAIKKK